jgi:hypothetical protein
MLLHGCQTSQGGNAESASALLRRFQQYTTQQCEQCDNVKYEREAETLTVQVEPGMRNGQVSLSFRAPQMQDVIVSHPDVVGIRGRG